MNRAAKTTDLIARTASLRQLLTTPQFFTACAQLARAAILAIYLLASTRMLGPAGYGSLAAAIALAIVGSTIVGIGSGVALVQTTAQSANSFPKKWGDALTKYLVSGLLLTAIYLLATPFALDVELDFMALLAIATTELVLNPITQCCAYALLANDRIRIAALVQLLPALGRLAAAGTLWTLHSTPSLVEFTSSIAIGALASSTLAVGWSLSISPRPKAPRIANILRPSYSWMYAASSASVTLSSEVDKAAALRFGTAFDAGLYAASSRIASALTLPFSAVIQSQSKHLFSLGERYSTDHEGFLRRYGLVFLTYGLLWVAVITLLSDNIALLLGQQFELASAILLLIAWWIPVNGFRQLFGAVLTTMNLVGWRISTDLLAGGIFVAAAFLFIPASGAKGTTIALLLSEFVATASMALLLIERRRQFFPTKSSQS